MASINWTMLSQDLLPLVLPNEKMLLTTSHVSLSLFPHILGAPLNEVAEKKTEMKVKRGTVHVSNQRVVFISDKASVIGHSSSLSNGSASIIRSSASETGNGDGNSSNIGSSGSVRESGNGEIVELQTLSIPLNSLENMRFNQPWFSATFCEGLVLPAVGGGLSSPHVVRFSFLESGGYRFYEVIEEMKARLATTSSRSAAIEPLPLYTPPRLNPPPPSTNESIPSSSNILPVPSVPVNQTTAMTGMPSAEELSAARVAREEEENERRSSNAIGMGVGLSLIGGAAGMSIEGPPGYEE